MPDPLRPAQFIDHLEVPAEPNVFVLGCFEQRVTLWAQQHRALNLIFSLHQVGRLPKGTRVAVIGGGVAGLTVTAAAHQKECRITLFERQPLLLHLLQGNHTRWVHPRIYDWPAPGSEEAVAGLPLLDWEAGPAGDVAEQILDGFRRTAAGCRVLCGVEDVRVAPGSGPTRRVEWNGKSEEFDLVILAVGFGIERTVSPLPILSYWRDDSLHQPVMTPGIRSFLVSGCGDGGLTDLLRIRIAQFRHERLVRDLLSDAGIDSLKARLLEIEQDLPSIEESAQPAWLNERYRTLPVPPSFDMKLRDRIRKDTDATLNGTGPLPLHAGSSVLNRFLAGRLVSLGIVDYEPTQIAKIEAIPAGYEVHFGSELTRPFNHVVIRHGPEPAVKGFPSVWAHHPSFKAHGASDQTRARMWTHGFYPLLPVRPVVSFTPPQPTNPAAVGRQISEVFRTWGVPQYNFVPPPRFDGLRRMLKALGRGLVVEGPTGIGKTVTVKRALKSFVPEPPMVWRDGYDCRDQRDIESILATPFTGHLVVDNVLRLDKPEKLPLVNELVRIFQSGTRLAKITLIGERGTGDSLMEEFMQLRNCLDIFTLDRQPDEQIGQLLYAGQRESNLRFVHPEKLLKAARGSCFIAQLLCQKVANLKYIEEAPADLIDVEVDLGCIIVEMMQELEPVYRDRCLRFASLDRPTPRPGACLALLSLLARAGGDKLPLGEVARRYPDFAQTVLWLREDRLAAGVLTHLKGRLTYDPPSGILTLQDPRLGFYLQYLPWVDFARQIEHQIGIAPNGDLVFP